jgi:hypothetical protein
MEVVSTGQHNASQIVAPVGLQHRWSGAGSLGAYDFGQYARRVADVEGVRRAALVAVTLRSEKVEPSNVSAALAASSLRDPYTDRNAPVAWRERRVV